MVSEASLADSIVCGTIAAVPSKFTPPIARGVASAVAVDALPDNAPVNVVAASALVLELYVNPVLFLGCSDCVPLAVTKRGKQVVSEASFAVLTVLATVAVIVPEPDAAKLPPVPTTIAAVVFVPLVMASKPTAPPVEPFAAAVMRPFASTVMLAFV